MSTLTSPKKRETFHFATSSGDTTFLKWLHQRLISVYKEDPQTDFVLTLKHLADNFQTIVAHNSVSSPSPQTPQTPPDFDELPLKTRIAWVLAYEKWPLAKPLEKYNWAMSHWNSHLREAKAIIDVLNKQEDSKHGS